MGCNFQKYVLFLLVGASGLLFLETPVFSKGKPDFNQIVINHVKKSFENARDLALSSLETYSLKLIKKSRVFRVSSAQSIPFRDWYVVVDYSARPQTFSYRDLKSFNSFIKSEDLRLETKRDCLDFVLLFVKLSLGNEYLIEPGDQVDKSDIKDGFKNINIETAIKIAAKKIQLTFFTINATASVKMWRLILNRRGELLKARRSVITHH